jgi:hypothetical protein
MTTVTATSRASIEIAERPAQLSTDALALLADAEHRSIQCGADWFALLAKHVLADSGGANWLVLREGKRCRAVWPVQTGQPSGAMSNYYTALYAPAHAAEVSSQGLAELARTLRAGKLRAGVHFFAPMNPDGAEFAAMESALQQAGFVTFRYFRFVNWYLPCQGLPWSQYSAERNGALRSTIRRMGKKLAADGGVLEVIIGGERLEAGLAAYEQVYAASWKQAEPYPGFVRELMVLCAQRGWLRLGVAWLGDRAIAAQFWIVAHGRAEIFKLAYDEAYKSSAAGTLLTAALMEHVLDQDRVSEVDYLIGDDPYKKTWMSHRRERWGIAAYDPRTVSGVIGLARNFAGDLKRRWWPRNPPAAPT